MKLVRIPKGSFQLGSTKAKQDEAIADYEKQYKKKVSDAIHAFYRSEGPRHEVQIAKAFWLGACEVTQGQFETVMGYNPSFFSRNGRGKFGLPARHLPALRVGQRQRRAQQRHRRPGQQNSAGA